MASLDNRREREVALRANLEALLPAITAAEADARGGSSGGGEDGGSARESSDKGGGPGPGEATAVAAAGPRRSTRQPTVRQPTVTVASQVTAGGGESGPKLPWWARSGVRGVGFPQDSEEEAAVLAAKLLRTLVGRGRVKAAEPPTEGEAPSWRCRAAAARDPGSVVSLAMDVEAAVHEAAVRWQRLAMAEETCVAHDRYGGEDDAVTPAGGATRTRQTVAVPPELTFLPALEAFLLTHPDGPRRALKIPTFCSAPLDLYLLFSEVRARGGHGRVTAAKQWKAVCGVQGHDLTKQTSAGQKMRMHYEKWLLNFEMHLGSAATAGQMESRESAGQNGGGAAGGGNDGDGNNGDNADNADADADAAGDAGNEGAAGSMDAFEDAREWSRSHSAGIEVVGGEGGGAAWDNPAERAAWVGEIRQAQSFAAAAYCVFALLSHV
jgi:hypothetical protein